MQIAMPKLNDTGDGGDIQEILVEVGDRVEAGDAVMTVEMEKSVIDIESTHDGQVKEIHVVVGDTVEVGQILVELE